MRSQTDHISPRSPTFFSFEEKIKNKISVFGRLSVWHLGQPRLPSIARQAFEKKKYPLVIF